MKNLVIGCILIISGAGISSGCSENEDMLNNRDEFFTAKVNGNTYAVNSFDIIECKKHVTDFGAINLAVSIKTESGKNMDFLILNYRGPNIYLNGGPDYLTDSARLNGIRMAYSETNPHGIWSTMRNEIVSNTSYLDITSDNGNLLTGTFSFDAQDQIGTSIRSISEGNFSIYIDR